MHKCVSACVLREKEAERGGEERRGRERERERNSLLTRSQL